jgi:hypothetical protein
MARPAASLFSLPVKRMKKPEPLAGSGFRI